MLSAGVHASCCRGAKADVQGRLRPACTYRPVAAGPRPALVIARDTCESIARVIGVVGLRFGVWPLASAVASRARADPRACRRALLSTFWQGPGRGLFSSPFNLYPEAGYIQATPALTAHVCTRKPCFIFLYSYSDHS